MSPSDSTAISIAKTPVRQLSVFLDNRVGALMALVKLLNEHHIEVLGYSLQEAAEITILRMIVTDPDSAATLFMERGIAHTDSPMVVVELREGAHGLGQCLSALLTAEINIRSSYPLLTRPDQGALLALHVDDAEVGAEALNASGFRVLAQGELSR